MRLYLESRTKQAIKVLKIIKKRSEELRREAQNSMAFLYTDDTPLENTKRVPIKTIKKVNDVNSE